jgi:hypothetical protein
VAEIAKCIKLRKKNISNHRPLMIAIMNIVTVHEKITEIGSEETIPEEAHLND